VPFRPKLGVWGHIPIFTAGSSVSKNVLNDDEVDNDDHYMYTTLSTTFCRTDDGCLCGFLDNFRHRHFFAAFANLRIYMSNMLHMLKYTLILTNVENTGVTELQWTATFHIKISIEDVYFYLSVCVDFRLYVLITNQ